MTEQAPVAQEAKELIALLRREGRHSGVWFSEHLLCAADAIAKLTEERDRAVSCQQAQERAMMMNASSALRWRAERDALAARMEKLELIAAKLIASSAKYQPDDIEYIVHAPYFDELCTALASSEGEGDKRG